MRGQHLGFYFLLLSFILFVFIYSSPKLQAQKIQVLNEQNSAIEAVWVHVQSNNFSAFTDEYGYVRVDGISDSALLLFSHLGYETIELTLLQIKTNAFKVVMVHTSELLEEVTVLGRFDQRTRDILSETALVSAKMMQLSNPQTTVDALFKMGEVFVQKSQMGGGSPVLRGFEANRILLVVDGIRMNNAIYRNGHLQNALTVDPSILHNIELIFGPSSLSYGSDALGGVIHFRTLQPQLNFSEDSNFKSEVDYKLRYASANAEKTGHVRWNAGWNNIAFLSGVSFSKYGSLRAGSRRPDLFPDFGKRFYYISTEEGMDSVIENPNPDVQIGTAYSQLDIFQKMLYKVNFNLTLSTNFQLSTSSNVPRYDFLTEKEGANYKYAAWYYGPQRRMLASIRMDYKKKNMLFDNAIFIGASQRIDEDRYSRKFGNAQLYSTREDLWVHSFTTDFVKQLEENHKVIYGLDIQDNRLDSKGETSNIFTNEKSTKVFSRYPDDFARQLNYGAYVNYIYDKELFQINAGGRISKNTVDVSYGTGGPLQWPDYFYEGINNTNMAFAWSAGVKFLPDQFSHYKLSVSSAFRTPNIDDLAKIRVKKNEILIPNPDLKPEIAYNVEFSTDQKFDIAGLRQHIHFSSYYNRLNDGIVRGAFFLPDGSAIYIDGNDSLLVKANQNTDKTIIYGFNIGLTGKLSQSWSYGTKFNWIKGEIIKPDGLNSPAQHIPPIYGTYWVSYAFQKWNFRLSSLFNGKKPLSSYGGSVDNPEYATAEGSYRWMIYNIHAAYSLSEKLSMNLAVENILDKHYRPFASGVSAPGINLIISIQGSF